LRARKNTFVNSITVSVASLRHGTTGWAHATFDYVDHNALGSIKN